MPTELSHWLCAAYDKSGTKVFEIMVLATPDTVREQAEADALDAGIYLPYDFMTATPTLLLTPRKPPTD
jgi:hypothetical protein